MDYIKAETNFNLSPVYSVHTSSDYKFSKKNTESVPTQIYVKQNIHKHQTRNFRRTSSFGIAPIKKKKKHIRLGHAGIVDHSVDLSIADFFKHKKGMDEAIKKKSYKYIIANTSVIWQHAAYTTDQLTSPSCYTGATQKKPISQQKILNNFLEKVQKNGPAGRKKIRPKE